MRYITKQEIKNELVKLQKKNGHEPPQVLLFCIEMASIILGFILLFYNSGVGVILLLIGFLGGACIHFAWLEPYEDRVRKIEHLKEELEYFEFSRKSCPQCKKNIEAEKIGYFQNILCHYHCPYCDYEFKENFDPNSFDVK